jgi:hypothetical protein
MYQLLVTDRVPPSPLVAVVCSVVLLVALVALIRIQRRPLIGVSPPRYTIWLIPITSLLATVIAGHIALGLEGIPYNVKELFQSRPTISLVLFGAVLLACGGVPHVAARTWQLWPYRSSALSIPMVCLCGLAIFSVLSAAVPTESLDDIVGRPVLGIGATVERSLRFTGLFAGPLVCGTLGVRIALADYARGFWVGLAVVVTLLLASYLVVVPLANTDNLVELLRGNGRNPAVVSLALIFTLFGLTSAVTSGALEVALERTFRPLVLAAVVLVCGVPVTWHLFVAATNPRLEKYGQVFSARQFLFSPDREHYLDDSAIFIRFALAQLLAVGILAVGMLVSRLVQSAWRSYERS